MHLHIGPPDERVPAIIDLPTGNAPLPGVLLVHGLGSTKEQMTGSMGRALVQRGIATLAIDLPLHGARFAGNDVTTLMNPMEIALHWHRAIRDMGHALRFLASHADIDRNHIGIAGYSLGAFVALVVAANDPSIRAVCLAAGGDLPSDIPFAPLIRNIVDPRRCVRDIAGRPLLMVNGRFDERIRPEAAEALFAAALEPKELRWYEGGHWPPPNVIDDAADWLGLQLGAQLAVASHRSRTKVPKRA
jgi:dienelactone hydrolase